MLQTLKNYNPNEVQNVLSNIATFFIPAAPGEEEKADAVLDQRLKEAVINEIRATLGLKNDDNSSKALNKINSLLIGEISKSVFAEVDENAVKARLGQKGDLSLKQYQIKYADSFNEHIKHGISKANIESTIRNPDYFQHLHPDEIGENPENSASLFTKLYMATEVRNNHTLLIVSLRDGYTQSVNAAWLIYHAEVDIRNAKTPLEMLKCFVNKYGTDMKIGNKKGRFFWDEKLPLKPNEEIKFISKENIQANERGVMMAQVRQIGNVLEVSHAYGIDLVKYENDLKKHKITNKK